MEALIALVVVGVVTELATGWTRSAVRFIFGATRRALSRHDPAHDDHTTIHAGWIRVDGGSWPRVHVHVRCAPSARWPEPRRMDRDGVYRFVHRVAPGVFPHEADYSVPDELIRFASATDPTSSVREQAFACASPTGVLEIGVPIEHQATERGPVISASAIAAIISAFNVEIASGAFDRIYGATPPRLDWFLNVSPSISSHDYQHEAWVDLDFPGRRPGGRASGMRPPADVRGYGRDASQSLAAGAGLEVVARPLLTDFLERNGFRDFDGTIDDLVDTTRSSASQQATS